MRPQRCKCGKAYRLGTSTGSRSGMDTAILRCAGIEYILLFGTGSFLGMYTAILRCAGIEYVYCYFAVEPVSLSHIITCICQGIFTNYVSQVRQLLNRQQYFTKKESFRLGD
jgi:hypothetical protein